MQITTSLTVEEYHSQYGGNRREMKKGVASDLANQGIVNLCTIINGVNGLNTLSRRFLPPVQWDRRELKNRRIGCFNFCLETPSLNTVNSRFEDSPSTLLELLMAVIDALIPDVSGPDHTTWKFLGKELAVSMAITAQNEKNVLMYVLHTPACAENIFVLAPEFRDTVQHGC
jgi:hypothetical protein